MGSYLEKRYKEYKSKVDFHISIEEFKKPNSFINIHENLQGTALRKIDKQLRVYEHIEYFGCMLFFSYLTDDQINNGPVVWEDQKGTACCF